MSQRARRLPASIDALRRVLVLPRVVAVTSAYFGFIAPEFGTWVAILVYAYVTTGPLSVGLVAVAQLVPAALVAPFAATIGERFARGRALSGAYALLAITMGATGLAMVGAASPTVVYALAIVAQASLTTIRPMQAAIVPSIVGTADQLTAANALSMVIEGVGSLVGPLVAGVILAVASPGTVLLVFAAACLAGSALVAGVAVTTPRPARVARSPEPTAVEPSSVAADARVEAPVQATRTPLLHGLRTIRNSPGGMLVISIIGARQVVAGALDVLLVIAAIELLRMGQSGAGYLSAAVGLGAVVGGATTLALGGRERIAPFLLVGAVCWGLFITLVAVGPSPRDALVLLFGAGVGLAVLQVTARTLLQRLMPVDALAGGFAVLEASIFGGLAVGAFVAAPLVAALGLGTSIVVLGLVMPLAAAIALPAVAHGERRIHIPLRDIALLRRLRLFAPVPAIALESAARRLIPLWVDAGETVIREGDLGDRFYVVVEGRVGVRREGRELRTLGPGEDFGEIALLRRVPRTATVVALEPTELRALERDAFLLAVTGTPQALDEADRVADAHLARDAALPRSAG